MTYPDTKNNRPLSGVRPLMAPNQLGSLLFIVMLISYVFSKFSINDKLLS